MQSVSLKGETVMHIVIKAAVRVVVILTAAATAKRFPSAAGLIGVMPLSGA